MRRTNALFFVVHAGAAGAAAALVERARVDEDVVVVDDVVVVEVELVNLVLSADDVRGRVLLLRCFLA